MPPSQTFPGFSSPDATPDKPLGMLSACHGRVQKQCQTLLRLAQHLQDQGCDPSASEAAQAVLKYFDSAARHHHDDEEKDLFPALLESMAGSDATCLKALTSGLMDDHRTLETLWGKLRPVLQEIADGRTTLLPAATLEAFTGLYEQHIEKEETELLPMAARLLAEQDLQRIGQAMKKRRGLA